jgi:hypothetical protein
MDRWASRTEAFVQRVVDAPEAERLTIILTELVRQMIELNASLNHIDKMMNRLADSLE